MLALFSFDKYISVCWSLMRSLMWMGAAFLLYSPVQGGDSPRCPQGRPQTPGRAVVLLQGEMKTWRLYWGGSGTVWLSAAARFAHIITQTRELVRHLPHTLSYIGPPDPFQMRLKHSKSLINLHLTDRRKCSQTHVFCSGSEQPGGRRATFICDILCVCERPNFPCQPCDFLI